MVTLAYRIYSICWELCGVPSKIDNYAKTTVFRVTISAAAAKILATGQIPVFRSCSSGVGRQAVSKGAYVRKRTKPDKSLVLRSAAPRGARLAYQRADSK